MIVAVYKYLRRSSSRFGSRLFEGAIMLVVVYKYLRGNHLRGGFQIFVGTFMLVVVYKYLRVHSCWLGFADVLMCVWGGLGQGPWGQLYNIELI